MARLDVDATSHPRTRCFSMNLLHFSYALTHCSLHLCILHLCSLNSQLSAAEGAELDLCGGREVLAALFTTCRRASQDKSVSGLIPAGLGILFEQRASMSVHEHTQSVIKQDGLPCKESVAACLPCWERSLQCPASMSLWLGP